MYNQQFEKMANAQREFFEPMREMNELAVCSFEKMARQNYDVAGDFIDFTVDQFRSVTRVQGVSDLFEQQVASSQSFAEMVGKRSGEYAEMSRDMFVECQEAVKVNVVEPAQRAGEKYSEAAKEFQDEMKQSFQSAGAPVKSSNSKTARSKKVD